MAPTSSVRPARAKMGKKTTSAQEKRDLLLGFFHSTKQVNDMNASSGVYRSHSSHTCVRSVIHPFRIDAFIGGGTQVHSCHDQRTQSPVLLQIISRVRSVHLHPRCVGFIEFTAECMSAFSCGYPHTIKFEVCGVVIRVGEGMLSVCVCVCVCVCVFV